MENFDDIRFGALNQQYEIAKSLGQEDEFFKSQGIDIEKARSHKYIRKEGNKYIYDVPEEELIIQKRKLQNDVDSSDRELNEFASKYRQSGGLIPDNITQGEKYKILKNNFNVAFSKLREFNSKYKNIKTSPSIRDRFK